MRLKKTVPVSDLRDQFPKVEKLLSSGEEILVTKRGQVIGRIRADSEQMGAGPGDQVLSTADSEIILPITASTDATPGSRKSRPGSAKPTVPHP